MFSLLETISITLFFPGLSLKSNLYNFRGV